MNTLRSPESPTSGWKNAFTFGFGGTAVAISLLSLVLIIVWLNSADGGGIGERDSSGVTAGYFNWHPLMMAVAFLGLMTPATSAFEVFSLCSPRAVNKNAHGVLQTLAVVSIAAGYAVIWDCHSVLSDTGLANSMHSVVGYLTMAMVGTTYLMGFVLYVLKWGGSLRGSLKPLHKRMGLVSWMLGFVALLMGLTEKANGSEGSTLVLTQVITGLIVFTFAFASFAVVKFEDKKDGELKYTAIPDAEDNTVPLQM